MTPPALPDLERPGGRSPGAGPVSVRRAPDRPAHPVHLRPLDGGPDDGPVGPTRRDDGYEDGYAAGTAAAAEEALRAERDRDAAVARAVGALERAVEEVRTAAATWRAEVEAALPAFVLDVVTALLDRELAVAADPGRDALARALVPDLDAGPAVARLHPDDLARLGDVEGLGAGHPLTVVADASVGPGGAVVEQGPTRIDARLTTALDRVRAALAGDDGDAP